MTIWSPRYASGIDVRTASDHGMLSCSDVMHLRWSTAQGCIPYSFNVGDFHALHTDFLRRGEQHGGIILAQQQRHAIGDQLRGVLNLGAARSAEEMINRLEFLSAWIHGTADL